MFKRSATGDYRETDATGIGNSYSELLNLALKSLGAGAAVGTGVGGVKLLRDYFKSRDQLPELYEEQEQDVLDSVGNAAHSAIDATGSAINATGAALRPLVGMSPAKTADNKQAMWPIDGIGEWTGAKLQDFGVGAGIGALTIPAAVLPAIGGFYGANYLIDLYRKHKLDKDVAAAKQEFQDALQFDPAQAKVASDTPTIGDQIDSLFYVLKTAGAIYEDTSPMGPADTELKNVLESTYKYVPHDPKTDTATQQSTLSNLGWMAALPLGLAATGTFLYAKSKLDADPELKRRKELKQMLRRQKALEAGNASPTITDTGIDLNNGV